MNTCATCGKSLGTVVEQDMFSVPQKCIQCQTNDRIRWILDALPAADETEWDDLTEWEQEFLPSVYSQFHGKGTLSEKQYEVLEKIYARLN